MTPKRLLDLAVVLLTLPLWAPVMACVALLVRVSMGSPVIFSQARAGLYGRPFRIFKFRTMTNATDAAGVLLSDARRTTAVGKMLRATSLDELPQLFNILRGELSLVGPRPLHVHYVERYSPRQAIRLQVLPGVTGWAQVNGRNAITWEQKFELDAWYVEHRSVLLDLKILLLTAVVVLRRAGVDQAADVTMEEFMGSDSKSAAWRPAKRTDRL